MQSQKGKEQSVVQWELHCYTVKQNQWHTTSILATRAGEMLKYDEKVTVAGSWSGQRLGWSRGGGQRGGGFPHVLVNKRKEKQKAKQKKKKLHDKEALKELTGNKYIFIYICPQLWCFLALWFHRGLMYNRPSVICPDPWKEIIMILQSGAALIPI